VIIHRYLGVHHSWGGSDWQAQRATFGEQIAACTVDASTLALAWNGNALAADQAYKNRIIRVKGWVDLVDRSAGGQPYIRFMDGGGVIDGHFMPVALLSWTAAADAAKIQPRREILVQGACIGRPGKHPILERCWVINK
jgi:hypothetical protein